MNEEQSVNYVSYFSDGRIQQSGTSSLRLLELQGRPDTTNIQTDYIADPAKHYVSGGVVAERPVSPVVLTGTTLTNCPVPCTLKINGSEFAVDEGTVDLSFPKPGHYSIEVVCWPYFDRRFEIDV